jgi:acetylcholinesterase
VQRSIDIGKPVVYVSMNYRLSAFGFLGGKEVKEAGVGNLGLQDRML